MARIGFIGTGEIAAAMVRGLAGKGHAIRVSERNADTAQALAAEVPEVGVASNQDILDNCDTVFLCLLKETAAGVLPGLRFRAGQAVVSVMAGVPHADLAAWCAPASDICTTIPLPCIAAGGCPLPVYPASTALTEVFGADNLILPQVSEQALNAHFAASAMASVVFSELRAASGWLADQTGDPTDAEAYLVAAFAGFFNGLHPGEPDQFSGALQGLSTEGGLNATLRAAVERGGTLDLIRDGLDRLGERLGLPPAS